LIKIAISFNGEALTNYLANAETNLAGFEDYLRNTFAEVMGDAVQDAKNNAPVETGRLRDSIRIEEGPDPMSYYFICDPKDEQGNPYAIFPERGTELQPGQYFMQNALADNLPRIEEKVKEKVKEIFHIA
jgi:HK97 gp10 family phage protein